MVVDEGAGHGLEGSGLRAAGVGRRLPARSRQRLAVQSGEEGALFLGQGDPDIRLTEIAGEIVASIRGRIEGHVG